MVYSLHQLNIVQEPTSNRKVLQYLVTVPEEHYWDSSPRTTHPQSSANPTSSLPGSLTAPASQSLCQATHCPNSLPHVSPPFPPPCLPLPQPLQPLLCSLWSLFFTEYVDQSWLAKKKFSLGSSLGGSLVNKNNVTGHVCSTFAYISSSSSHLNEWVNATFSLVGEWKRQKDLE